MCTPPNLTNPLTTVESIEGYTIYGNAFHDSALMARLDEIIIDSTQTDELRIAAYIKLGECVGDTDEPEPTMADIEEYTKSI